MNRILYYLYLSVVIFFSCWFIFSSGKKMVPKSQGNDRFRLRVYEATIKEDRSLCKGDKYCLDHMRYYRSLICIDEVCNSAAPRMRSIDCAPAFAALYEPELQEKISSALCSVMKYPSAKTRRAYLSLVINETEGEAIELGGYLMALKGSAAACERYIKEYVGPYGAAWNFQWYRAMSGCRILAKERTVKEEEKDLNIWLGVSQRAGQCSDIAHREMREACSAPGARSPAPAYELLW